MDWTTCCVCAQVQDSRFSPYLDEKTEKEVAAHRYECCNREVCPPCLQSQPRFRSYCPYCQQASGAVQQPDSSKSAWARHARPGVEDSEKSYDGMTLIDGLSEDEPAADVLHFVDPNNDSINSLAIRYAVPAKCLRHTNGIYSDHLLAARRSILIPGEYYKGGVSLSPRPIEGEEEEARKGKLRRFQTTCKVPE
ncbi:hypothetical protein BT63DRAFT_421302 [Microthyrium microscopicum]|uniref:LysM domain-containing protein n=1 Tax=Microthyrium microscopicum TaxID=703497 RepID=A0A6A6UNU1_9PEZI|nr:hypothetical protein BT63DRAFT_421302 [Microthyrium microscopicum]